MSSVSVIFGFAPTPPQVAAFIVQRTGVYHGLQYLSALLVVCGLTLYPLEFALGMSMGQ
jgi:hypothetical protein